MRLDEYHLDRFVIEQCTIWLFGRRKVYDTTGSLADSEELAGESFDELYSYYRQLFKKVEPEDILSFEVRALLQPPQPCMTTELRSCEIICVHVAPNA